MDEMNLSLGDELSKKLQEHIRNMLDRGKYEPYCQIPEDVMKEWLLMSKELCHVTSLVKAAEARKTLFWTSLEARLNIYNRGIRLDTDNNMIMLEVESPSIPPETKISMPNTDGEVK
ncbi:MAG: hypothetical protein HQK96_07015 [Nitrospirae bacterium]|nr:hypothetical protein [Nitrospirota bacterium]